jgi:hypothetical protein
MSLSHTLSDAHPAAKLDAVLKFATNRAPETAEAGAALFAAYAGGAHRAMAACNACGGRGKTEFLARPCEECGGSGFVAAKRR